MLCEASESWEQLPDPRHGIASNGRAPRRTPAGQWRSTLKPHLKLPSSLRL